MITDKFKFARKLYRARRDADMTQQELADFALVNRSTITKWESAKRTPHPNMQKYILDAIKTFGK